MLNFKFAVSAGRPLRVLCLGAHCDDLEIGCGGTILHLQKAYRNMEVVWVVFGGNKVRKREAKLSAELFLEGAEKKRIILKSFKDGFYPYSGGAVKKYFEELKKIISPDIIFTHCRNDLHQDHRLLAELTWNTFRDHLIMEYEIIKYDGDIGTPNVFVPLSSEICKKKIEIIDGVYRTQRNKNWFDKESFLSIVRLRGLESRSPSKYAEAFYCRKMVL